MNNEGTCRFCGEWRGEKVRYGTRHYAHFACYLDAGKSLADLWAWQLQKFPYAMLKERGLVDRVKDLIAADASRNKGPQPCDPPASEPAS